MYFVKLPPAKVTFTHFTTKSGQEQVSHLAIYYLGYEMLVNNILNLGNYIPPPTYANFKPGSLCEFQ